MIVPLDLYLADVSQRATARDFLRGLLVRLTAVLGAYLNNRPGLQHGIARRFRFGQNIAHRLLDVCVFARFGG